MNLSSKNFRNTEAILGLALAAFAAAFAFACGARGIFAFDQGHVFDGAYRMTLGQVPYKDFLLAYTPGAYVLQAVFFKLFGVNYDAFLLGAASFNVLAALLSFDLARLLFPGRPALAAASGFLTAIWFYPPFGTPNMERAAFFFALAGLWVVLSALLRWKEPCRAAAAVSCGLLVSMVFLSKQYVAPMILPLYFGLWFAGTGPDRRRGMMLGLWTLAGAAFGLAIFFLWLQIFSDPRSFLTHSILIPAEQGSQRLDARGFKGWLEVFLLGLAPVWKKPTGLPFGLASLARDIPFWVRASIALMFAACFAAILARKTEEESRRRWMAAETGLYLIYFQYFFIAITNNIYLNGFMLIGPIAAIGWGLASERSPRIRIPVGLIASLLVGGLALLGWRAAWQRDLHDDLFSAAQFKRAIPFGSLSPLRWGEPTMQMNHVRGGASYAEAVWEKDFLGLLEFLKAKDGNFFIFPDYGFLYGVLGKTPPQPMIEFTRGKNYPNVYDPRLDERIARELEAHDVRTVVLERVSFKDTQPRLDDFPLMKSWIERGFKKTREFGIFEIYERV